MELKQDTTPEALNPAELRTVNVIVPIQAIVERIEDDGIKFNTYDHARIASSWHATQRSRWIESILIGLPLTPIIADARNSALWEIVDGKERLQTLKRFVIHRVHRLHGLEFLPELEDTLYDTLPARWHRRLSEAYLPLILIEPGTPDNVVEAIVRRWRS